MNTNFIAITNIDIASFPSFVSYLKEYCTLDKWSWVCYFSVKRRGLFLQNYPETKENRPQKRQSMLQFSISSFHWSNSSGIKIKGPSQTRITAPRYIWHL